MKPHERPRTGSKEIKTNSDAKERVKERLEQFLLTDEGVRAQGRGYEDDHHGARYIR